MESNECESLTYNSLNLIQSKNPKEFFANKDKKRRREGELRVKDQELLLENKFDNVNAEDIETYNTEKGVELYYHDIVINNEKNIKPAMSNIKNVGFFIKKEEKTVGALYGMGPDTTFFIYDFTNYNNDIKKYISANNRRNTDADIEFENFYVLKPNCTLDTNDEKVMLMSDKEKEKIGKELEKMEKEFQKKQGGKRTRRRHKKSKKSRRKIKTRKSRR